MIQGLPSDSQDAGTFLTRDRIHPEGEFPAICHAINATPSNRNTWTRCWISARYAGNYDREISPELRRVNFAPDRQTCIGKRAPSERTSAQAGPRAARAAAVSASTHNLIAIGDYFFSLSLSLSSLLIARNEPNNDLMSSRQAPLLPL
jgi:hypothetical protein